MAVELLAAISQEHLLAATALRKTSRRKTCHPVISALTSEQDAESQEESGGNCAFVHKQTGAKFYNSPTQPNMRWE